ncbi:MAG: hypothetical protein OEZ54_07925 [Gemmatimonadota bacterium]|nr:hypothetical protein [Gemmatimonadota bacterium]
MKLQTTALILVSIAVNTGGLSAQSIRIKGTTTLQYLDVRPYEEDSIPVADASGSGLLRRSEDGFVVRCVTGADYCRFRRPSAVASTLPALQDININAWGFGRGIRAFAQLRGRAMGLGDEALWPRSDDHFDVLAAYLEINRSFMRGRLGRQFATGFGFYNYDGASLRIIPFRQISMELYGGLSLARGLNEPLSSSELNAVETFSPEEDAYIVGGRLSFHPTPGTSFNAAYQRDIRTDRLGLYSERMSLNTIVRSGPISLDGSLQVDWASGKINEGKLRFWLPRWGILTSNIYGRHHNPYFALWTIWGAFNPLSFNEVGTATRIQVPRKPLSFELHAAARRYVGTEAEQLFGEVRNTGWRISAMAGGELFPRWQFNARYGAEVGFGAARSDGSFRLQHTLGTRNFVGVTVAGFQKLYELRTDDGTAYALGADANVTTGERSRVFGSFTVYQHSETGNVPGTDWIQMRGSLRFEWTLGAEPEVRPRRGGLR